ncbi:hypothetical protein [Capnocytophaga canis]|uniref:hypothetical protein n=1 Tax=Capnocytophaga canis TaxID=1848903 RepID=UPI001562A7F6|nr:hypothetical protein [Capnocytophaga canis]
MVIHLTLTALDRVYNYRFHTENFYGYFFEYAKPKEKPKSMPKEEPRVRCYYTDLEDNPKAEVYIGDEVYLVIESEKMIGEIINIELSDEHKDFEYQGEILENDILRDILIEEDYQKILLKVVAPQKEIDNMGVQFLMILWK